MVVAITAHTQFQFPVEVRPAQPAADSHSPVRASGHSAHRSSPVAARGLLASGVVLNVGLSQDAVALLLLAQFTCAVSWKLPQAGTCNSLKAAPRSNAVNLHHHHLPQQEPARRTKGPSSSLYRDGLGAKEEASSPTKTQLGMSLLIPAEVCLHAVDIPLAESPPDSSTGGKHAPTRSCAYGSQLEGVWLFCFFLFFSKSWFIPHSFCLLPPHASPF